MGGVWSSAVELCIDLLLSWVSLRSAPARESGPGSRHARRSTVVEPRIRTSLVRTLPSSTAYGASDQRAKGLDRSDVENVKALATQVSPTPQPQPTLNLDVIDCIMYILPRNDLLSIMLACRATYSTGLRHLLRAEISVSPTNLEGFCDCLLRNRADLCTLMRRLKLRTPKYEANFDPSLIARLTDVLSHAHFLEELDVYVAQSVLSNHPGLYQAITSLERLRVLVLTGHRIGEEAVEMVARITSPIVKVYARFDIALEAPDANRLLAPFVETLQDLRLSHVVFKNVANVQYGCVRKLDIQFTAVQNETVNLIQLFPNLLELRLRTHFYFEPSRVYDARPKNQQAQAQRCWPRLDFVGGSSSLIYAAGLLCGAYRLETFLVCDHIDYLAGILMDAQPRQLVLELLLLRDDVGPLLSAFQVGAPNVTDLTLTLLVYEDMAETWEDIVCWLALQTVGARMEL
ncbi:hypothetical protein OBBRIDRAFT_490180 [Obba rivulosa]|uniref:F-box domain-containing protein n=1 Tax=Obba rivulosa TaxID=1052685 RepID=A0A8E2DLU8_9APHY|nr:hypothetical protein OBBRIDRAFT_490180 [Obba rivulosa]